MKGMILVCIVVGVLAAYADSGVRAIGGTWQSEPVRLVRPGLDETFIFFLNVDEGGADQVLDIDYFSTASPADRRRIRQDVSVRTDDATGMVVFQGANPRLISGPAIEGVYAPDALCYEMPKAEGAEVLSCSWGSSGHEDAPAVKLFRSKSH